MDSSGAWKLSIAKELKAAGYQIDFNNIIWFFFDTKVLDIWVFSKEQILT